MSDQKSCCDLPLDAAAWEKQWNTLRKRPKELTPAERAFLSAQFPAVHFRARPQIDPQTADAGFYAAKCGGWLGLGLWHASRWDSVDYAKGFSLKEICQKIIEYPDLVAALLFGQRIHYDEGLAAQGIGPLTRESSEAQREFSQKIANHLCHTADPADVLRKWMDRAQPMLAQASTALMEYDWTESPAGERVSQETVASAALAVRGKRDFSHLADSRYWASQPVLQRVAACFFSVLAGFELLKITLSNPEVVVPPLMTLALPVLHWSEILAILSFSVLVLESVLLILLQRGRHPNQLSAG